MNISLPSELKRFVERKVGEGTYATEAEVAIDALWLFKAKDQLFFNNSISAFRRLEFSELADGDIMALAFTVLMQATKDMDEDLKMIMAEVRAMNTAKHKLRELIQDINKDIAANVGQKDKKPPLDFSAGLGSQQAYHRAYIPYADPESEKGIKCVRTDLYHGKIVDIAQLEAIRDNLKAKLDNMSETSELGSLRLQMMMDRRSKFIFTISNLMKRISDTQDTLVQNLK